MGGAGRGGEMRARQGAGSGEGVSADPGKAGWGVRLAAAAAGRGAVSAPAVPRMLRNQALDVLVGGLGAGLRRGLGLRPVLWRRRCPRGIVLLARALLDDWQRRLLAALSCRTQQRAAMQMPPAVTAPPAAPTTTTGRPPWRDLTDLAEPVTAATFVTD